MANFIQAKDYFDPRIYERMAQIRANAALQQGDIRAKQSLGTAELFSNLIQQLAQLGTKAYQAKEANEYFSPKDYSVGDIPRGQQQVTTDLLGRPITQQRYVPNTGFANVPAPVTIPQYQEQGTFDPSTDPQRLMQGRMSQNPQLAQMAQTGIENLLMQQPKYQELSAGAFGKQINPFSVAQDIQVPNKPVNYKMDMNLANTIIANPNATPAQQKMALDFIEQTLGVEKKKSNIIGERQQDNLKLSAELRKRFDSEKTRATSFVDENQNQMLALYQANGQYKTVAIGKAGQKAPQISDQDKNLFGGVNVLKQDLEDVKKLYKPEYVGGIFAGGGALKAKIGEATGSIAPEQADFRTKLQTIFNTFGELRSGKVLTANELQRLEAQLPNENMSPVTFNAAMKNFEQELDRIAQERASAIRGSKTSGKKTIKLSDGTEIIEE